MAKEKKNEQSILSTPTFKAGFAWILLIVGVILIVISIFWIETETWKALWLKIGEIFVVGVLLGFISSYAQFMGIFKNELEDIIYDAKFLKRRTDIHTIWENVSKIVFKSKFPSISHNLLETIKTIYFPLNEVSYYSDYNFFVKIEWDSEDKRFIKVTQELNYDLYCDTKDKFIFPSKTWLNVCGLEKEEYHIKLNSYTVNKSDAKIVRNDTSIDPNNGENLLNIDIELSGSDKYNIIRKIEKRYCIEKDYHISFRSKYIVNNMRVQVFFPSDLDVHFLDRGTVETFINNKKELGYMEYQYKGLILPKQGFIMILKPNNNNSTI